MLFPLHLLLNTALARHPVIYVENHPDLMSMACLHLTATLLPMQTADSPGALDRGEFAFQFF
jgi:hypothetical protein